ncbi:MAG: hypothetical protein EOO24_33595 [Comamonadaceae bacterium]|nr:MAG: hypothetical protein EOO24_33595 [Comamonadaceae bacterium]
MPNIASILKAEISRVARREVRAEIESLKKASVQHRSAIAALRRQVDQLHKDLRRTAKAGAPVAASSAPASEGAADGTPRRFSATRLAAHRAKLALSAAAYGTLVGVSSQTIYNWEQGKSRPGKKQLDALVAVRGMSRAEVAERLG